jgi:hypothetical protein
MYIKNAERRGRIILSSRWRALSDPCYSAYTLLLVTGISSIDPGIFFRNSGAGFLGIHRDIRYRSHHLDEQLSYVTEKIRHSFVTCNIIKHIYMATLSRKKNSSSVRNGVTNFTFT